MLYDASTPKSLRLMILILMDHFLFSAMDPLVEHAPLAKLLSALPKKAQRGLFSQDITWTCLAANNSYIAVGSNIGTIFLYHRHNGALDRLTCKVKLS
jgi:hypothetical protein